MIIFNNNLIDNLGAGDLTESSEELYLPVDNVLDPMWSKPWRTEDDTTHTLVLDFTTDQDFTGAAVLIDATTTISSIVVEFSADDITYTDSQTLASSAPTHGVAIKTFATVTERYARLTVTLGSSGYIDLFAFYLGEHFTPANGIRLQHPFYPVDQSSQSSNSAGERFTEIRDVIHHVEFDTSLVTEAARELWTSFVISTGIKQFSFVSFDPTNYPQTKTLYGKFIVLGTNAMVLSVGGQRHTNRGYGFEGVRTMTYSD